MDIWFTYYLDFTMGLRHQALGKLTRILQKTTQLIF
jgi:hypothetical protein